MQKYEPVVLIILDGWGIGPQNEDNAISQADTPFIRKLQTEYPNSLLQASGEAVGLPWQEMGNSEVGHLNIGAGRIVLQELPEINNAIADGSFFQLPAFLKAIEHVRNNTSKLHLIGLVSPGGVHSHLDHLYALLELFSKAMLKQVFVHAFLDGRDTDPKSGLSYLEVLDSQMRNLGVGKIATICGRFFAMDRDNRWERVQKAYEMMVQGKGKIVKDFYSEIKSNYQAGIFDENIEPIVVGDDAGHPVAQISENDAVIFFNYRSDRAREITAAFIKDDFQGFIRGAKIKNLFFVSMKSYSKDLNCQSAFSSHDLKMTLAETVSRAGLAQMHIAETEKYAHVTYFFNGGREKPWPGEDQILIPSPKNLSYAEVPAMSSGLITEKIDETLEESKYDLIIVNFANPDMVAHTGNLEATIKAVESVDQCLDKIVNQVLEKNGVVIITGDHGNAEQTRSVKTGDIETQHSANPVPFILVGKDFKGKKISQSAGNDNKPIGFISDIAPTILNLLNIPKPSEMTGMNLLDLVS